ncbi:MAG TPA: hypothetical protein VFW33_05690 [Gemmataceae bacterium]|nr:hypothetical protein [Gemmataceae bacterium]
MSRTFPLVLVAALVGCSGTPVDTGSSSTPRGKSAAPQGTRHAAAPSNAAAPGATPKETPKGAPQAKAAHTPERLQELIADLRHPDDARRVGAAKELQGWGKGAAAAAGPLATVIATSGAAPREAALEALEAVLPDHAADLHALVAGEDTAARVAAEKRLAGLSPEAGKPLAPIIDWRIAGLPAEARKPNVGYAVAGEEYAALAPLLLKWGVDGPGLKAVGSCATVPAEGGKPLWEPAQQTLCEIARNETYRKDALAALDSSLSSRPSAATLRAVGDLGPSAKGLAPLLETLATDRDAEVRKAAAEALKKVHG